RFPGASTAATDLGGQVHFAYDETNLYVAFQVDDDGYVKYSGDDETYFLGDSPQLSLDMDLLGDFNDGNRSADDWQVDFLPDLEASRVALWQLGTLTSRSFDEARLAVAPTAAGYLLEAALPWASFSITPQPGDRLGLAANINDNDTPGANAQECIISTAPEREWNVPTTWGTLLLRPGSG
ncbi:MAG TPA: sugar-binding protein, partial [Anaerolineae bacterium]